MLDKLHATSAKKPKSEGAAKPTYRDVREYLAELEKRHLLQRVTRPMNKDTEIMPLVRWQFRGGLPESQRKGWLFESVTDSRGRKFDGSVAVAIIGASTEVYAAAMGVKSAAEIGEKWKHAQAHPIVPIEVSADKAPVKQVKILGKDLISTGGIDKLPVTITNPGSDSSAYFSAPCWVTKDPETGVYNVGTYRAMVKAPDRIGVSIITGQDGRIHWEKARALGKPLEAVLILSPPPSVSVCSVNKLNMSEYDCAGGIDGAPLELVKAETVDLLIPAHAEIAIEGRFRTDILELEGPFGEFAGYVGAQDYQLLFEVTAITHREKPILQAFISEMPPSESSCMRKAGFEGFVMEELKLKVPHLKSANVYEIAGSAAVLTITLGKGQDRGEAWDALRAAASARNMPLFKFIIAVDDDIDSTDLESVLWAIAFRVQPHRDIQIQRGRNTDLDPSGAPVDASFAERTYPDGLGGSQLLIDATLKWAYPPVSLPAKNLMEDARKIWEELKLPALTPKMPWFGYPLGYLPEEWDEAAKLAVKGDYMKTGEKYKGMRTTSDYFETGKLKDPETSPVTGSAKGKAATPRAFERFKVG
jgi:4-hydroxy-3-polyprenylbenzoate decarboxylase